MLQLVAGEMNAALIYDSLNTHTQLLMHMNGEKLALRVVDQSSWSAVSEHKYYTPHVCHHSRV